jgi:hypothetical protein
MARIGFRTGMREDISPSTCGRRWEELLDPV